MLAQENRLVFNYSEFFFVNFVPSYDMYGDRLPMCTEYILAHLMRISDILSSVRNSFVTNVILPRLWRGSCTLVVLELTHMVVK